MSLLIEKADIKPGCLAGEVVVITGAGRGIGRQTALVLGYLGASVAIAEISDSGQDTRDDIRVAGGKAIWVKTDISDPDAWARFRDRVIAEWGKVDVVINNAEAVYPKAVLEHSIEEWERVFAVNCRGVFLAIKLFLPAMLERHHGVIVFMPSAQGIPYAGAYSASKAAQESLSSSLAQEVGAGAGVAVITFGVGMVETPATQEYVPILASRYGMSQSAFIALAAPGGSMVSAELVATGLAGVIVHAAEWQGDQVDWPAGLARIGLTAAGLPAGVAPIMARTPAPDRKLADPAVHPTADIAGLTDAVDGVVKEIRDEYEALGMFQKQWYKRTIRHRTGMDIEGWEKAARAASGASRVSGEKGVDPAYGEQLRRLADHLERSEADWRGYVTDPEQLKQGIAVLERRRAAVLSLTGALMSPRVLGAMDPSNASPSAL